MAGTHKLLVKGVGSFWSQIPWAQSLLSPTASCVIWGRVLKYLCFNFFTKLINKYGDNILLHKAV